MDEFFDKHHVYWIGPRESDIRDVKYLFAGSITFFGEGGSDNYNIPDNNVAFFGSKTADKSAYLDHGIDGLRCGNYCISRTEKHDHNNMNDSGLDKFIFDLVKIINEKDPTARFYMYNPNVMRLHGKEQTKDSEDKETREKNYLLDLDFYKDNYVCLNDIKTMEFLDNKSTFRSFLNKNHLGDESLIEIKLINGKKIESYYTMCNNFGVNEDGNVRFIVQERFASGGVGTHILSKPRFGKEISFKLNDEEEYLCSVLQEDSISVNAHIVIFENEILLLPPSVQIICENNNCLLYRGGDYASYKQIDGSIRRKFEELCAKVADIIMHNTDTPRYYGIMGIDAIIRNGSVFILECNNRFQSSTYMLNMALTERNLPSLQELNYIAFTKKGVSVNDILPVPELKTEIADNETKYYFLNIPVNYSNFDFLDSGNNYVHAKMFAEKAIAYKERGIGREIKRIESDGFVGSEKYLTYSYLYRVTFNGSCSAISPDGKLLINENVCESQRTWMDRIYQHDPVATKIALLVQGVRIADDKSTAEYLQNNNGFRPATNDAIDLNLKTPVTLSVPNYLEMIVNAPVFSVNGTEKTTRFTEFSPFELKVFNPDEDKPRLGLYYYGTCINDNIGLFCEDPLSENITKSGIKYSEIAFLSGDRLRVHTTNTCRFKKGAGNVNNGCRFCNMSCGNGQFTLDDVKEVVSAYKKASDDGVSGVNLQHYLVGGQSPSKETGLKPADVIKAIHEIDGAKNIYVMILPPSTKEEIIRMKANGATEFSFNIEVFNDFYARKYMPGKATSYNRTDYLTALNTARFIMDDDVADCVRSMVIAGLEPLSSLMQGLRVLIANGIQPMLSVFRPLDGTPLEEFLPPSMTTLYKLYFDAEKECETHSLHLGPVCRYCQNNTLSLPY